MKYYNLKAQLERLIVFSWQDIYLVDPQFRQATLYDWIKKGLIIALKKNRFVFADFQPTDLDRYLLSNQVYQPSYVSLEMALNHYSIIPEAVESVIAITTRKTAQFSNQFGRFAYQTIAKHLFWGYLNLEHQGRSVQLATLEKAILDYLYLHPEIKAVDDLIQLRWNQTSLADQIDWHLLEKYQLIFDQQSLNHRLETLKQYIQGDDHAGY